MHILSRNFPLCLLILFLPLSCEHFQGRLFNVNALVLIPGLVGKWSVKQDGKETSVIKISVTEETRTYLLEVEGDIDRSLLRFAWLDGRYIGEYHDVTENGEESSAGHIFELIHEPSGWKAVLGAEITKVMVTKYKLQASPHKQYGNKQPGYYLNGSRSENLSAVRKLILDPDFFPITDLKKAMFLTITDSQPKATAVQLKDFLNTFAKNDKTDITEFESFYEIVVSHENGGAEKYNLDKLTGKSTMIWHEHPNK